MKFCLINPPDPICEDAKWDEPLGLLYLAAVLMENGYEVEVLDMNFYDGLDELRRHDADVYGIYCSSALLEPTLKINSLIKEDYPEALRIVGGPHATCMPEQMAEYFDKVVVGEGEKAIIEVLEGKWVGKLVHCPPIEDLDTVPFPARSLVPIKKYHRRVGGRVSTGMITARGCPHSCAFCSKVWGKKARFRSAGNIISEVEECINDYGIRAFSVRDDTFTLNKKRLFKILDGFKKLDVLWRCLTRVDQVDEKTLQAMKEAGCVQIVYGIESGSQKILDNLNKGTTVKQNVEAIRLTKKVGIPSKAAVIVGNPGETWDTVAETIQFIDDSRPDEGILCVFTPFPGSPAWENPDKFKLKILTRDLSKYVVVGSEMQGNVVVETEEMTASEIAEAHDLILNKFKEIGAV